MVELRQSSMYSLFLVRNLRQGLGYGQAAKAAFWWGFGRNLVTSCRFVAFGQPAGDVFEQRRYLYDGLP